jgi:hypothetical protein
VTCPGPIVADCFLNDSDSCYDAGIDSLHDRGHDSCGGSIRAKMHVDKVDLNMALPNRCRSLGVLVFDMAGPFRPVRLAENAIFDAL